MALLGMAFYPTRESSASEIMTHGLEALTAAQEKALLRGDIVVRDNPHRLLGGVGYVLVNASPAQVWAVVTDYAGHPNYLHSITKSTATYLGPDRVDLYTEYKTPWPFDPIYMESDVVHRKSGMDRYRMEWVARKTNLTRSFGSWQIQPFQERTLMIHEMNFDIPYIPRPLAASLAKQAMEQVIETICQRANALAQPTP